MNRIRWLAGVSGGGPGGRDMRRHALDALRFVLFDREAAGEGIVHDRLAPHPIRATLAREAQRPVDCPVCGALVGHDCLALCVAGDDVMGEL